jgi:hypothetical protein
MSQRKRKLALPDDPSHAPHSMADGGPERLPGNCPDIEYVILWAGVAVWKKGDVVHHRTFLQRNCDINGLLGKEAIRVALESERGKAHVELPDGPNAHSYDALLARKDAQIAQLTSRVMELEEAQSQGKQVSMAHNTRNVEALLRSKDELIADLNKKVQDLAQERDQLSQDQLRRRTNGRKKATIGSAR